MDIILELLGYGLLGVLLSLTITTVLGVVGVVICDFLGIYNHLTDCLPLIGILLTLVLTLFGWWDSGHEVATYVGIIASISLVLIVLIIKGVMLWRR